MIKRRVLKGSPGDRFVCIKADSSLRVGDEIEVVRVIISAFAIGRDVGFKAVISKGNTMYPDYWYILPEYFKKVRKSPITKLQLASAVSLDSVNDLSDFAQRYVK